jgi:hypothetical protein
MVKYKHLAKNYNILDTKHSIKKMLNSTINDLYIENHSKRELHILINDLLLKNYPGEETIKYALTKHFINKNVVAAYEVNTLTSRADFISINGSSHSFEIKSDIDTLYKICKQTNDYSKVYEYNNVVAGPKHLIKISQLIPKHVGIWTITSRKNLKRIRPAKKSPFLSSTDQLKLLTKKELNSFYNSNDHFEILDKLSDFQINQIFKKCLKARYKNRWTFLKENNSDILPYNYQFFFNSNLNPEIIYDSL